MPLNLTSLYAENIIYYTKCILFSIRKGLHTEPVLLSGSVIELLYQQKSLAIYIMKNIPPLKARPLKWQNTDLTTFFFSPLWPKPFVKSRQQLECRQLHRHGSSVCRGMHRSTHAHTSLCLTASTVLQLHRSPCRKSVPWETMIPTHPTAQQHSAV